MQRAMCWLCAERDMQTGRNRRSPAWPHKSQQIASGVTLYAGMPANVALPESSWNNAACRRQCLHKHCGSDEDLRPSVVYYVDSQWHISITILYIDADITDRRRRWDVLGSSKPDQRELELLKPPRRWTPSELDLVCIELCCMLDRIQLKIRHQCTPRHELQGHKLLSVSNDHKLSCRQREIVWLYVIDHLSCKAVNSSSLQILYYLSWVLDFDHEGEGRHRVQVLEWRIVCLLIYYFTAHRTSALYCVADLNEKTVFVTATYVREVCTLN